MLLITRKETWFPFYAIIIYYFIKNFRSKSLLILFFLALTILASDQFSVFIKETVQRLRPVYEPAIENLVHNVLRKGGLHGFVSSHAANSFAILVFTARIFKNKSYSALLLFWAIIFSYSRIYSGVHYPLDIIGGAILGWLIGFGFHKLVMVIEKRFLITKNPKIELTMLMPSHFRTIFLVFAILVSAMFIISHLLHYYNYL
jgi:undecaprenyl-diphosphatase